MQAAIKLRVINIEPTRVGWLFIKKGGVLFYHPIFWVFKREMAIVFLELLICFFRINHLWVTPWFGSEDGFFTTSKK